MQNILGGKTKLGSYVLECGSFVFGYAAVCGICGLGA